MKISILLPFKENFSPEYAGAVSLYIDQITKKSMYKKNITVFGSTHFKKKLSTKYKNIFIEKLFFQSNQVKYIKRFIELQKKEPTDLIEVHNRPLYLKELVKNLNSKFVFHFHNDPLAMNGSKLVSERISMINNCGKIIFCSHWVKNQFIKNINLPLNDQKKLIVIEHSIDKKKVNLSRKKKIITFVGRLNRAKGYDLFGDATLNILKKYKDWEVNVVGDEPREILTYSHKNFKTLGFLKHAKVLKLYEKTSIAITCSRWNEPFGRTSMEASSRGCAVIVTNRGGLKETVTDAIILNDLKIKTLFGEIEKLILNKNKRLNLQKKSLKNFFLTHELIAKKTDDYRNNVLIDQIKLLNFNKTSCLKILHVTNFNYRFDGRLFYNTGKRLNNGFIQLGHAVLEFSDRDIIHDNKKLNDLKGSSTLNNKLITTCDNFKPDLIIFGHADKVSKNTISSIKNKYPHIRFAQWFLDPLNKLGPDYSRNKSRLLEKSLFMDANFLTTSPEPLDFIPNKDKFFFMPNPSDKALDNLNIYNNNCENDVFFAMSHGVHRGILKKGKYDERDLVLKKINRNRKITTDFYGYNNRQPVWSQDFLDVISNCKMGLNLSRGKPLKYYSSDRIAQFMGNGMLTLIDIGTKYDHFFTKNEMVFYKNSNDLVDKILKYKRDDKQRIKIAQNGQKKYNKYFNSVNVAEFIINKTFDYKNKNKFIWSE